MQSCKDAKWSSQEKIGHSHFCNAARAWVGFGLLWAGLGLLWVGIGLLWAGLGLLWVGIGLLWDELDLLWAGVVLPLASFGLAGARDH